MNKDRLIKISNIIGLVSIILLVYWVFVFICITVFGLKIFKENITESFYLSIIGILALMFGALMINIMFNLTKISDYISQKTDAMSSLKKRKFQGLIFILSFPVIFVLLYMGDFMSNKKKEKFLLKATDYIVQTYEEKINLFFEYEYTEEFITKSNDIIDLLEKSDESIQGISVIVKDSVQGEEVYLMNGNIYINNKGLDKKINHIFKCSKVEKEYLNDVFNNNLTNHRFDSHDGNYELYYPYHSDNRTIVFYYTEYQRYGKYGS